MNIEINSDLERYVVEQVKSGRFSTIAEVLEAAIERLIFKSEFEEEEEQALAEAERQIAAGETITF
jgi:putative addiction module CopG family antidote